MLTPRYLLKGLRLDRYPRYDPGSVHVDSSRAPEFLVKEVELPGGDVTLQQVPNPDYVDVRGLEAQFEKQFGVKFS